MADTSDAELGELILGEKYNDEYKAQFKEKIRNLIIELIREGANTERELRTWRLTDELVDKVMKLFNIQVVKFMAQAGTSEAMDKTSGFKIYIIYACNVKKDKGDADKISDRIQDIENRQIDLDALIDGNRSDLASHLDGKPADYVEKFINEDPKAAELRSNLKEMEKLRIEKQELKDKYQDTIEEITIRKPILVEFSRIKTIVKSLGVKDATLRGACQCIYETDQDIRDMYLSDKTKLRANPNMMCSDSKLNFPRNTKSQKTKPDTFSEYEKYISSEIIRGGDSDLPSDKREQLDKILEELSKRNSRR